MWLGMDVSGTTASWAGTFDDCVLQPSTVAFMRLPSGARIASGRGRASSSVVSTSMVSIRPPNSGMPPDASSWRGTGAWRPQFESLPLLTATTASPASFMVGGVLLAQPSDTPSSTGEAALAKEEGSRHSEKLP